jgi:4-carboxymuconolactone decarboxylase
MTELPLVQVDGGLDPITRSVFREISAIRGEVTNLFRVIANEPTLLPAFFAMSRRVRDESTLPPRVCELAILATALTIGSRYEIAHHLVEAELVGISREEIARLVEPDLSSFPKDERSVIAYARQVAAERNVDDATLQDVLAALGESGTAELAVIVGWYHLVAAVVGPLRIAVESDKLRNEEGPS